jgi:hypothetical protein
VFLHSWNEWCEGTYVEPDGRYGRRLLEQTKAAVDEVRSLVSLGHCETAVAAEAFLRRVMHKKDEGAARSLQAVRQQNTYLYREIERQHEEIAVLKQTTAAAIEAEASHAALKQQATAAAIQAEASRKEAEASRKQAEEILQGVLQSKSWRITKPLRDVIRFLNRNEPREAKN